MTQQVTEALEQYRYSDAARTLYDFSWVEFCSSYIEMIKGRFPDPQQRVVAQRMAAYTLDVILRLLHPVIPFITEELWQLLGSIAPARGLGQVEAAARHVEASLLAEADAVVSGRTLTVRTRWSGRSGR